MLVHLLKAMQHGAEILRPDGQHRRQTDCRAQGITPANPVPEAEHIGGIDAELRHLFCVRRHGDEVPCDRLDVTIECGKHPVAGRVGIGHRLLRRERL